MIDDIGRSLAESGRMLLETWWALVLGFGLSGIVQTWIPKQRLRSALGDHRPTTLLKAGGLGALSSSCSYAASAVAKTLFVRGADFVASMAFMIAATNLVLELGLVLWLLIGWQLALAEFVGGAIMVMLLGILLPIVAPRTMTDPIGTVLATDEQTAEVDRRSLRERIANLGDWADAASAAIGDLTMVRSEIVVGFLVAGFASELVPVSWWQHLLISGHGQLSTVENVAVGPLIAVLSFVCSIGNVALAAALWHGGATLGGTMAFVFADLITLPLLAVYRRYYGLPLTLRLLGCFWLIMSAAGWLTQQLFTLCQIPAPARPKTITDFTPGLNLTTGLDVVATLAAIAMLWLARSRDRLSAESPFAIDPVCGMQVERSVAATATDEGGNRAWFCCDGCKNRWLETALTPTPQPPAGSLDSDERQPAARP